MPIHKNELLGGAKSHEKEIHHGIEAVGIIIPRRKLRNELRHFYHDENGDVFITMKKLGKEKWFQKLSETRTKKVFEIKESFLQAKFASEAALYFLHPVIQSRIAEKDSRWEPLVSSIRPWNKLTSREWKIRVTEVMEIIHVYDT